MTAIRRLSQPNCHEFMTTDLVYSPSHSTPLTLNATWSFSKNSPLGICMKVKSKTDYRQLVGTLFRK